MTEESVLMSEQTPEEKALWENFLDVMRNGVKPGKWLLVAHDNFDYGWTNCGQFDTEAEVLAAAKLKIKDLPNYLDNSIETVYYCKGPDGKQYYITLSMVGLKREIKLVGA